MNVPVVVVNQVGWVGDEFLDDDGNRNRGGDDVLKDGLCPGC